MKAAAASSDPLPTRWAGASDAAVLGGLADHDEDALRELHRRYARAVYALAMRSGTPSPDEAVQQAFVAMAWHAADHAQSALGARVWILAMACWTLSRPLVL